MSSEYNGPETQPGFSFQPGQLIPMAPTIFPGEQELFYLLEFAEEFGGYWVALVAGIIQAVLELIDELVLLFTGKPRAQDTLTVAKRFAQGSNPVAHIVATQIHRNLQQNDIVLSSSNPADQTILGEIRHRAAANLVAQGATLARATRVVDQVWSHTTSATQPLPTELQQPLPQGLTLVGPSELWQLYTDTYNKDIANGKDPEQAAKKASRVMLTQGKLGDIGKITVQPQLTPRNPPPPQIPPGQPPPPPCTPTPQTPPCVPVQDGQGDELTDGLACVSQNLINVQEWLRLIAAQLGTGLGATDPVTCTQLTAQVALITAQLETIAESITNAAAAGAGGTESPVDLTPITAALTAIATVLALIAAKPDLLAPIPPSSTTTVDNRFGAFLSATLTQWVNDGTMTAADTQGLI